MVRSRPQPTPQVSNEGILAAGERCVFAPSPAGEGISTMIWSIQSKDKILGKEAAIFLQWFCCLLIALLAFFHWVFDLEPNGTLHMEWNKTPNVSCYNRSVLHPSASASGLKKPQLFTKPFRWTRRERIFHVYPTSFSHPLHPSSSSPTDV